MEKINELLSQYPQFKKTSLLYDSIVQALGCGLSKAKDLAATHCNIISFWGIIYSSGEYKNTYAKFFKWMLDEGYLGTETSPPEKGYINCNKKIILDKLLIDSTLTEYRDYEDIINPFRLNPEKYYQVRIKADTSGKHFMACYLEDGVLFGTDTSYRGNPFKLTDKVTQKNFEVLLEVC
jgi:hypothetical protein